MTEATKKQVNDVTHAEYWAEQKQLSDKERAINVKPTLLSSVHSPTGRTCSRFSLSFASSLDKDTYLSSYDWLSLQIGYGAVITAQTLTSIEYTAWNSAD